MKRYGIVATVMAAAGLPIVAGLLHGTHSSPATPLESPTAAPQAELQRAASPRTALVITDPQNDFLSPDGVAWGLVGTNVTANNTIEHIEQLRCVPRVRPVVEGQRDARVSGGPMRLAEQQRHVGAGAPLDTEEQRQG